MPGFGWNQTLSGRQAPTTAGERWFACGAFEHVFGRMCSFSGKNRLNRTGEFPMWLCQASSKRVRTFLSFFSLRLKKKKKMA